MADPNTQKIVTNMNAGWYNAVTQAMGIADPNFQLTQGMLGLSTTDSSGLFLMADSVPPSASVAYFVPGATKRSSTYQMLLGALLVENGTDLVSVLGDMYAAWVAYKTAFFDKNPTSTETQLVLFKQWANQRLDPRKSAQAISVFLEAANAPLNQALDALSSASNKQTFTNSTGNSFSLYTYSGTVDAATRAINTGASATINFDSRSMDTTLKHVTAQGSASGFYDIFSASASGSFDQLNKTAGSSHFTIKGTINKFATLNTDPIGWYTSSEVARAFNAPNDNTIWDPQANSGNWNSYFGQPSGSLVRNVSQLYLVSDYDITVTSSASYSESDVQQIKAQASLGMWPFFSASGSTAQTTTFTRNADSSLSARHVLNKGLIQIWGVSVAGLTQPALFARR